MVEDESQPAATLFAPELEWLASLTQQEFSAIFRGSAIKRAKWRGLVRNACVALGNSKIPRTPHLPPHHRACSKILRRDLTNSSPSTPSGPCALEELDLLHRERVTVARISNQEVHR